MWEAVNLDNLDLTDSLYSLFYLVQNSVSQFDPNFGSYSQHKKIIITCEQDKQHFKMAVQYGVQE